MSYLSYEIKAVVGDANAITARMSNAYERGYISVVFYSDAYITPVLPSVGQLTFTGSETGDRYAAISNGVVDVTTDDYTRPSFSGSAEYIKVSETISIVGATHYKVTVHRFTGA